jgi:hypothetical protein
MIKPASYSGTATVRNRTIESFETAFNPLNWHRAAPYLWTQTYLIAVNPPGRVVVGSEPEGGTDPATGLPRIRSNDPAEAPKQVSWTDAKFFEAALFGGYLYRNVLKTSLIREPSQLSLVYAQVECLDTLADTYYDGGIDLDYGQGSATQSETDKKNHEVQVAVSKTVRFTQPTRQVSSVNQLAHVLVPLSFDFWLHCGLFAQGA